MQYLELIARVAAEHVERAADVLRNATGRDVWFERPFRQLDLESDAVIDATQHASIHAYASSTNGAVEARARLALIAQEIPSELYARVVDEEDWAESWKEHFHIQRVGERIVIVPSWREYAPVGGDVVIALDPGMAFGTGQHETTRMCLEALERSVRPGARVLDVGTGSGILAIAAAKLGAGAVYAVDTDADCARITAENARANDVDVGAAAGSLGAQWPFGEPAVGFDVVVANIIARVIVEVADALVGALAPGGRLIVSGVIGEREAEVTESLTRGGARIEAVHADGEWRCIEAARA